MKEYTAIIKFQMSYTIHGRGGNKEVLRSAIRQQVAGLINDIKRSGLIADDFDLDSGDDESISKELDEILERLV